MRILAIESSAATASAAVTQDAAIVSEVFAHTGLTHSRTLMNLVDTALCCAELPFASIDAFALSNGPGSFTGVRIGCAAVKGMALPARKPCIPVSTLEAIAYPLNGIDAIACAVMDARCSQVYTAAFDCGRGFQRLYEDCAISIEALGEKLKQAEKPIFFIGDGAQLCYNELGAGLPNAALAPEPVRFQRASSVALCAFEGCRVGRLQAVEADRLAPSYLRLAQAQRELKRRKGELVT